MSPAGQMKGTQKYARHVHDQLKPGELVYVSRACQRGVRSYAKEAQQASRLSPDYRAIPRVQPEVGGTGERSIWGTVQLNAARIVLNR